MTYTSSIQSAPVPINDYLGDWTSTAAPFAAGNVVTYSNKTWLSLVDGNTKKPGAASTSKQWRLLGDAKTFVYKVGDKGPGGGWIFFVDEKDEFPGFTYLEAAPEDVSGTHEWCSPDSWVGDARGEEANALGRGKANTQAIISYHNCGLTAALAATYYRGPHNKTDWYLPSEGELMVMYENLFRKLGKGGFSGGYYWSSTESERNFNGYYFYALYQNFSNGKQGILFKDGPLDVRAVRSF